MITRDTWNPWRFAKGRMIGVCVCIVKCGVHLRCVLEVCCNSIAPQAFISKWGAGSAEIWTRIAGFRVLSANHYTTEPIYQQPLQQAILSVALPNECQKTRDAFTKVNLSPQIVSYDIFDHKAMSALNVKLSTRMGFEPTRAEPNGLAVHRLNHSATSSFSHFPVSYIEKMRCIFCVMQSSQCFLQRTEVIAVSDIFHLQVTLRQPSSSNPLIWKRDLLVNATPCRDLLVKCNHNQYMI